MEVDTETVAGMPLHENPSGGLDSDDETLRFDKDDDLYAEDLDEEDARWVRKQVRERKRASSVDGRASERLVWLSMTPPPLLLNFSLKRPMLYSSW